MPYKSEAQRRKLHAMAERGEIDPEVVEEFDRKSEGKKLPERVRRSHHKSNKRKK